MLLNVLNKDFYQAVEIFGMGMAGIFVVMILIALTVFVLAKVTSNME